MKPLSVRIRRAAARWLFAERKLRAHYVAEELGIGGGRQADAIGLWLKRDEVRGIYRKVTEPPWAEGAMPWTHSRRVDEKTIHHPAECRIVEVKISRTDFLVGRRKGQLANVDNGLGAFADYCYLAVPEPFEKILRVDELPAGWGLLECSPGLDYRGRDRVSVDVLQQPTRLTPAHPFAHEKTPEDLARRMAQSCMWRLYGFDKKEPDELDVVEVPG